MIRSQILKFLPGAREGKRGGSREIPEEELLPDDQWRRVGMSGSLRGRRSEEMTQSNTFSPWGSEVPFESHRGVMVIEVPQN